MERYSRQTILPEVGKEGQEKLLQAKILVIGAGGLGTSVLTYLVAGGVGTIGIVDDDVVSLSNLQRQILYTTKQIGEPKVLKAKEHLNALNPDVEIRTYKTRLSQENAPNIAQDYDMIIDCTDNYETRYLIDSVCKAFGIPMIYGSISKFSGQVSIFNYRGSKSYSDLFPEAPKEDNSDESRLGVVGTLPGIIGSIQANEAIKLTLGLKDTLVQKLLLLDIKTMQMNIVAY